MPLADEVFNYIVHKLTNEKQMEFAAYMPRFIVDQVVATCRFMGQTSHYEPRYIDYALDNLRVKSSVEIEDGCNEDLGAHRRPTAGSGSSISVAGEDCQCPRLADRSRQISG